ncbi:MAG TPA: hypothetical protein VGF82_24755 [Terracidiphilus sp.]
MPPNATLPIVNVVVPLFVNVATFCPPIPPTTTETQFRFAGLAEALPDVELVPVPVRATACGLPVAESVKLSVAVRDPAAVGLNTTEAEQLPDAARLVVQVLLAMLKSAALVPEIATELIVIDELVPFVSVTDFPALAVPTFTLPNERLVGLAVTDPEAAGAYPVSVTFCGVLLAESLKFSVAERFPVAVGANVMFAVQLADAPRLVPHVFEKTLKSPGFVPVKVMLLIVTAADPLFVSVATFCPPMPPTGTEAQLNDVGEADCAESATGSNITPAATEARFERRTAPAASPRPRQFANAYLIAARAHKNAQNTHVDISAASGTSNSNRQ